MAGIGYGDMDEQESLSLFTGHQKEIWHGESVMRCHPNSVLH